MMNPRENNRGFLFSIIKTLIKNSLEPYEIDIIEYVNANENNGIRKDPDNNGYLNTCVVCGQEFHTASKRIAKYCKIRRTHHYDKCGFEWDVICSGNSKKTRAIGMSKMQ